MAARESRILWLSGAFVICFCWDCDHEKNPKTLLLYFTLPSTQKTPLWGRLNTENSSAYNLIAASARKIKPAIRFWVSHVSFLFCLSQSPGCYFWCGWRGCLFQFWHTGWTLAAPYPPWNSCCCFEAFELSLVVSKCKQCCGVLHFAYGSMTSTILYLS